MTSLELTILLALASITIIALQIFSIVCSSKKKDFPEQLKQLQNNLEQHQYDIGQIQQQVLRTEIYNSTQGIRQELVNNFSQLQQTLATQITSVSTLQHNQIDTFAQKLVELNKNNIQQLDNMHILLNQQAQNNRKEQAHSLKDFGDNLSQSLASLNGSISHCMLEIRTALEMRIKDLQNENTLRLEEMRKTVDEKLHTTLEKRLGESFRTVSERLERVYQGLGEMQQLVVGVGDLKRLLSNVKTRGTWGEVQLEMLLQQILIPGQYGKNIEIVLGSQERVEFAIKLPGTENGGKAVWMPIDAKFPKEQYERLADAAEKGDTEGLAVASRALEKVVRYEAKNISEKYLSPPLTTDFGILFLPTEGLYSEVIRRPGLADDMQRLYRISIAGPSTLSALLNSLQMGFRTLALEKRSSEVWQVLGAVKTEFNKFGDALATTKSTLERAAKNIDQVETRSRQMSRKLKSVEALPSDATSLLIEEEQDQ